MPEVSVIVPNYNHAVFLFERINSILNQTYQDFEIIILDDCSSDHSREVIEQYRSHPKVTTIIYNDRNSGSPFAQWKKGIELASGRFIWIAESDDYAENLFLEKLVGLHQTNSNIGIAFCNSNWVDDRGERGISLSLYTASFCRSGLQEIFSLLKVNTIQNVSSVVLRGDLAKSCLEGLERYKACGDWLFYIRILKESNICYTNDLLNNFRWYHNNTSNTAKKNDLWTLEGVALLAAVSKMNLCLKRKELNQVISLWVRRIKESNQLPTTAKIRSFFFLLQFSVRQYLLTK